MPRDNVELAQRAYDAVNRRDVDAFLGLMDDDVEVVAAMEGNYHGHDEVGIFSRRSLIAVRRGSSALSVTTARSLRAWRD